MPLTAKHNEMAGKTANKTRAANGTAKKAKARVRKAKVVAKAAPKAKAKAKAKVKAAPKTKAAPKAISAPKTNKSKATVKTANVTAQQKGGKPKTHRYFKIVQLNGKVLSKEDVFGRYSTQSTPINAATKAVSKICKRLALDKKKRARVTFMIKETTQGSDKKMYGPYEGIRTENPKSEWKAVTKAPVKEAIIFNRFKTTIRLLPKKNKN